MTSHLLARRAHPVLLVALLALAGCSSTKIAEGPLATLQPYRVEIVQGNVVTREMTEQLKPGMTRQQVRETLGAPLLTDPFHADRWDYVFSIRRQGTPYQQRRVTVVFGADERVTSIEADELPSEREFVASIDRQRIRAGSVPTLELTPAQVNALPRPKSGSRAAVATGTEGAAAAPARSYPPLEPIK